MSALDDAKALIQANSRTLAPAAVFSQILLMSAVSAGTILAFNVLRPKNKIIFEPKVKYHVGDSKRPPRMDDSICGWVPPLIHTKEPELVDKIGLDAAAFLRFGRLMRWLFSAVALLSCGVLIPVNVIYNLKNVKAKNRNILSMMTIRDVSGNLLFIHVAVTYLITFIIMYIVYMNWVQMLRLRRAYFRSPEYLSAFFARTLAITHVPKNAQSDDGIKQIFDSVRVPYPTTSVHIGRKVGKLPELIQYHNDTVRELETYLVQYLHGGKVGKKRPTIRVGGSCGFGGEKKDAIQFYTEKLKRTEAAIEDYRAHFHEHKPHNYGFASMAAVPYAHVVAKFLQNKHPKGTDIFLAPNPKDIIWENLHMSSAEAARRKMMGFIWLAVVCFINTVPLFVISILANLASLTSYVGFLDTWNQKSNWSFVVISGILPPAVSGLFGFFLPIIMRSLAQYMGATTTSKLDRDVVARYFAFLVISQLVIFTLIGVIFQAVEQVVISVGKKSFLDILKNFSTLPDTINSTYINQSSYWLTFFPLRGFLVLFDLAQVVNVIWIYIKTHLFGRTPRDIREWTQPPEFQYAIYYSNLLFMGAVGLVFAPLAPLVVLAAAAVLWMSSFVQKYQLMFVYITRVETGGRLWNVVVNRLLFVVVLMQLLMTLTIGLQFGFRTSFMWVSTLPPIVIIAGFKIYLSRTFTSAFRWYIPSAEELETAKIHSERADARANKLEKRFGHPALHSDLFTPMLHSNMMGLLGQVYSGKIARDHAKLEEYGGQKMEAQLVAGIKIAAIDQRDLEFDPTLYRKNQVGDDWDAQSIASTTVFGGSNASLGHAKSHYYASDAKSQRVPGYNSYLANGPVTTGSGPDIELARMDSMNEPLLSPNTMYFNNQSQASVASPPSMYREPMDATSQAPLYRPQGNFSQQSYDSYSPDSQYQPQQQQYPPQQFHRQDSSYSFRPESSGQQHPGRMSPSPSRFAASPAPQRMMTPNPQQQWGPDPRAGTPNPNNMAGRGTSNFRG